MIQSSASVLGAFFFWIPNLIASCRRIHFTVEFVSIILKLEKCWWGGRTNKCRVKSRMFNSIPLGKDMALVSAILKQFYKHFPPFAVDVNLSWWDFCSFNIRILFESKFIFPFHQWRIDARFSPFLTWESSTSHQDATRDRERHLPVQMISSKAEIVDTSCDKTIFDFF